jgi:hypothetical protein
MAPEQLDARGDIGPWTDLYAFGVILYELLCGQPPITAPSLPVLLARKQLGIGDAPLPWRRGIDVPDELEELVRRLLAPEPRQRPRFAREVARALALIDVRASRVPPAPAQVRPDTDATRQDGVEEVAFAPTMSTDPAMTLTGIRERRRSDVRTDVRTLPAPPVPGSGTEIVRLRRPAIVGRKGERRLVEARIDEVCTGGATRVVTLIGSAGTGKSAIAHWGLVEVERSGKMEGAATGYDVQGAAATAGLRHVTRRLLGRTYEWLHDEDHTLPFDAVEMKSWLAATSDAAIGTERAAALTEAAILAVCRLRPVYLWLDDAGWSRDGALDLVERLLRANARALVVMTLQAGTAVHPSVSGALERIQRDARASTMTVEALDEREREALLASAVTLAPELSRSLAARLAGAPLLLLNRVYSWLDEGVLVPDAEGHQLAPGLDVDALFSSAQDGDTEITSRVDRLIASFAERAPDAEAVMIVAALLGIVFEERVLVDAFAHAPETARTVGDALDRALLAGLVRAERGTSELRFDHGLVQASLLARLDGHPERTTLLRATADALGRAYEGTRAGVSERRADLFRQVDDIDAAVDAILEVSHAHARRSEFPLALEAIETARAWMNGAGTPQESLSRARALLHESELLFFQSDYARSEPLLRRATELLRGTEAHELLAKARTLESGILLYQDRIADAERVARTLVEDPRTPPAAAHHAWHRLMQIRSLAADHRGATACNLRSMVAARRSGEMWRRRCQHLSAAEQALAQGRAQRARRHFHVALESARLAGDSVTPAEAAPTELWLAYAEGRLDDLREIIDRRLPGTVQRGDTWRETLVRIYAVLLAVETGAPAHDVAGAVDALLIAYTAAPHDDPSSRWGMWRAGERLEEEGHHELARRTREAFDQRTRALAQGLGQPVWDPATAPGFSRTT